MAHLVEVVGVCEHERALPEVEDIEFDQVDAYLDRCPERAQGVLGRKSRRTTMADPQRTALAT